jgi:hypothetical protein
MQGNATSTRLPFSFHQTFVPERTYLSSMLRFAASGKQGDHQTIASETGIPMGKKAGKAPAILDYCRGMGLIEILADRNAIKTPSLTPFGRIVLLEDSHIAESLTQWLAHFHLCRPIGGAEAWFLVFAKGRKRLGDSFARKQLEDLLQEETGHRLQTSLIGPLIRTYTDPAALAKTGLLEELQPETIQRRSAPTVKEFARGYAAWMAHLMEVHFVNERQVTVKDLDDITFWGEIGGWTPNQCDQILNLIQSVGVIDVDRQMRPWVITRLCPSSEVWPNIFRDLV